MFLHEMSERQRREIAAFEDRLLNAGWNLEPVSSLLHSATWVSPEGSADLERENGNLAVDFFLDGRYFDLIIEDAARRVRFKIIPGEDIESILAWLVDAQESLDPHTYPEHLRGLIPLTAGTFYLDPDGSERRLELEPRDHSG